MARLLEACVLLLVEAEDWLLLLRARRLFVILAVADDFGMDLLTAIIRLRPIVQLRDVFGILAHLRFEKGDVLPFARARVGDIPHFERTSLHCFVEDSSIILLILNLLKPLSPIQRLIACLQLLHILLEYVL